MITPIALSTYQQRFTIFARLVGIRSRTTTVKAYPLERRTFIVDQTIPGSADLACAAVIRRAFGALHPQRLAMLHLREILQHETSLDNLKKAAGTYGLPTPEALSLRPHLATRSKGQPHLLPKAPLPCLSFPFPLFSNQPHPHMPPSPISFINRSATRQCRTQKPICTLTS